MTWSYWQAFERDKFNGSYVTKQDLFKLTRYNNLSRIRAKIQNEYKLFEADAAVTERRRQLSQDVRREVVEDKPAGAGVYMVYIDETGKNEKYLCIGSLWLLDADMGIVNAKFELTNWRKDNNINYEFHFSKLNKNKLDAYKAYFDKFLSLYQAVSFKAIVLNSTGIANQGNAITELTYHLIIGGIEHEHSTGRAPLPRVLQVVLDEEEKGSDQLKMANIKDRLKARNIEGLYMGFMECMPSKDSDFIQIIDLYTGAINRKLNPPSGEANHKDEFAEYVLNSLSFSIDQIDIQNTSIDHSVVFNLR